MVVMEGPREAPPLWCFLLFQMECLFSVSSVLRLHPESHSEGRPSRTRPWGPAEGEALLLREPEGQRVYFLLPHRDRVGQHTQVCPLP